MTVKILGRVVPLFTTELLESRSSSFLHVQILELFRTLVKDTHNDPAEKVKTSSQVSIHTCCCIPLPENDVGMNRFCLFSAIWACKVALLDTHLTILKQIFQSPFLNKSDTSHVLAYDPPPYDILRLYAFMRLLRTFQKNQLFSISDIVSICTIFLEPYNILLIPYQPLQKTTLAFIRGLLESLITIASPEAECNVPLLFLTLLQLLETPMLFQNASYPRQKQSLGNITEATEVSCVASNNLETPYQKRRCVERPSSGVTTEIFIFRGKTLSRKYILVGLVIIISIFDKLEQGMPVSTPFSESLRRTDSRLTNSLADLVSAPLMLKEINIIESVLNWLNQVWLFTREFISTGECSSFIHPSIHPSCQANLIGLFIEQDNELIDLLLLILDLESKLKQKKGFFSRLYDDALVQSLMESFSSHILFLTFMNAVGYDEDLLLDWLTSSETEFLKYFLKYLRLLETSLPSFLASCLNIDKRNQVCK